ncbi:hypothetical protein [Candidatus Kuenenia stuttgartiensis]|uniref:Uncharacterized protein n=1 Tax=Kuenenia stuttgartiensis TaxID=174633 RepID=Q1Q5B7_KUEST|nr:hypothetical protein [Candidatus Kuenenia stuttgartiensis]CAJ75207.1 unknown protein [Candidatus Kuenenia stuttgartiensis]
MKKIAYGKAASLLITFIEECDADELAYIFGDTFGYDVLIDDETEQLECTPNGYCGFILEGVEKCHT